MEQNTSKESVQTPIMPTQSYLTPIAIVIAGGFIAAALYFSNAGGTTAVAPTPNAPVAQQQGDATDNVRPVTKEDHIRGNPDASVIVVEYSDYECPFCKRFHDTMNAVIKKAGPDGDIAWVFRQFPLDQLHPKNARKVAIASECANEQGGNDAFWKFTDRYMELTATNDRTDLTVVLPKIYSELGLDQSKMTSCIASGKYDKHVQDDVENAIATGGRGTPWSVVIGADGKTYPLNGAQPQSAVEQLLSLAAKK